ncbi:nitrous oxide reductase family maturation protein NosD [Balneolaceae bacterium YR4-1]|uniref:Nitrous oxide reductase family maturation protein NosD n=1 Tax=Halalkalibaculum roseum TaxID=2709311 RepID=A0A6M1SWU2_9BACT|nr:nitrous oxide reductase family maturation protein NosD [Halalkalibaculum roseum]NGP77530.1 nitrous oxide reductase family maturation protein NosD [Halalkalibaculum roseum]
MWANIKQILFLCGIMAIAQLSSAQDITVSPNGDISSLTEAVAVADSNSTIILTEGIYTERNITINKPLTIEGSGRAIIDAEGEGYVLIVRSDNVTLKNIEVRNAGISFMEDNAGILYEKVKGGLIENVTLTDNFFGIYLSNTSDTIIRNNILTASSKRETQSGNGIHLWYSKNITIEKNTVRGHRDGIYFEFVEDVTIRDNLSEENLRYGQHFMFSDRCVFTRNTYRNNGAGVAVMYTDQVTMTENNFEDNWGSAAYGLLMKEIRESEVYNNRFENNSVALYMEASSRNRIKQNEFVNNGWAVKVMANSMDNQFVRNNFVENSFDVATNSRQNFNIFNRNYWSHYEGYDLDRDGVGDVPYRPVRLFSIIIEKQPEVLVLMRSMLIGILDAAERLMPVLTPEELVDKKPQMARIQ